MTPDQADQIIKSAKLTIHSNELMLTRMNIETLEALATVHGWTVELLQRWTAYNGHLMILQIETRKLLAF